MSENPIIPDNKINSKKANVIDNSPEARVYFLFSLDVFYPFRYQLNRL